MTVIKGNYITIEEMPLGCVVNDKVSGGHVVIGDLEDADLLIDSLQRLKAEWHGDSDEFGTETVMNNGVPYEGTIEFVYDGLIESVRRVANFPKPTVKPTVEKQVVYKLRHKHTGLFFEPQQYHGNVSKTGKVYSNRRPARQSHITIPYDIEDGYDSQFHNAQTKLGDWEVIRYTITEIKE